jgi:NTE family protein
MEINSEFDTLCFGSGGIQGIMYISAIKYLVSNNYLNLNNIVNYYGTSIGAIIAFLFIIGYNAEELINIFLKFDLKYFEPEIDLLLIENNYGLDDGVKLTDKLIELLKNKINVTDITFIELYNLLNKKITVNATNLNTGIEKIFNYLETPNLSVILAIRMSISIPMIYTPVLYNKEYYVDGALKNKLLLKYCNSKTTLGFRMKEFKYYEINSFQSVLITSLQILLNNSYFDKNIYKIIDFEFFDYTIIILDITTEYLQNIFNIGEQFAKKFYYKELKKKIKLLKIDIENNSIKMIKNKMDTVLIELLKIVK